VRPVETPTTSVSLPNILLVQSTDVDTVQGPTTRIDGAESILHWLIADYTASHPEQFRSMVGEDAENANGPWICIEATPILAPSLSYHNPANGTTPEVIDDPPMLPATNPPISINCSNFLSHPISPWTILQ